VQDTEDFARGNEARRRGRGWHRWVGTFNGVAPITVAALPLAALVVWALARRRSADDTPLAWRMSLAEVGIVYGTVPRVWMIMLPGARAGEVPGRVSLVPLRDLLTIFAAGPFNATGSDRRQGGVEGMAEETGYRR
jgi:hypothetical protein